jgi:hypothetical protein
MLAIAAEGADVAEHRRPKDQLVGCASFDLMGSAETSVLHV